MSTNPRTPRIEMMVSGNADANGVKVWVDEEQDLAVMSRWRVARFYLDWLLTPDGDMRGVPGFAGEFGRAEDLEEDEYGPADAEMDLALIHAQVLARLASPA